jgi:tetratricopeptide (TPR) repeat protein
MIRDRRFMQYCPRPLWIYTGLFALIFAVYGQVARFDFVNYDDPDYVTLNPHVTAPLTFESLSWAMTTGYAANWHPVTWLSHMLDFQLFGLNGGFHHLTSVLLHVTSTMLLFAALWRMTAAFWPAALVAGLFALHPLRVESVVWIAERKDTLSTFFWMLTMLAYARYVERPNAPRYLFVFSAFTLGLMSKSMLVTLPFVLLLLDVWPLHRINRTNAWRRIAEKVPMIVMSSAVSVLTYLVQQRGGAVMTLNLVPFSLRVENALISYGTYLRMLIWPVGLAAIYPFPRTISLWQPIATGIVLTGMSLLVFWKGRSYKYLTVGWVWYLGTLVPVLGLIQVGEQARADRYTYTPSIGFLLIAVWGVRDMVQNYPRLRRATPYVAGAVLAACVGLSAVQVSYWRNTFTLFSHAIAVTENNYFAYNALGALMLSRNSPAEALPYLSKALEYNPYIAQAQANMGMALDDLDRRSEALSHFKQAIQIDPENADAQAGLGLALTEMGAGDEGLAHMREALRLRPDSAHDYFELGEVYGLLDRMNEAEQAFRDSIRLEASDPRSHFNLGIALGRQGKLSEAADAFRAAIHLKPDYPAAWFNLGSAQAQDGLLNDAVTSFNEAVRLKPDFSEARDALAGAQDLLRQHE